MLLRFMRIVSQPPQEQFDLLLEAVNEVLNFAKLNIWVTAHQPIWPDELIVLYS